MLQKKTVSIIIPNYNGRRLLEQYLPHTLQAVQNAGTTFEIIVIDDCSTDDSVSFIHTHYPEIKLLQNHKNSGFSYTCNQGIQAAQMELILILNSDVKLSADYFEHLWPYFAQPDTFGVMGRIKDMDGPRIQDAARMPKLNGLKLKSWFYYLDSEAPTYTLYLSGANALVDARKLKTLQGFNLLFSPFYGEDFELSLRAWRMGWPCYYEHRATCGHEVSASTKNYKTARWVKMIYFRNRYYLHALHLNGFMLVLWFLQITFIDLLPKMLIGQFWIGTSYLQFLKHRKEIKQARKAFYQLMHTHASYHSLNDVLTRIKQSVKGKRLVKVDE